MPRFLGPKTLLLREILTMQAFSQTTLASVRRKRAGQIQLGARGSFFGCALKGEVKRSAMETARKGIANDRAEKRMKSDGQRARQRLKTREAILDATESIMREEGYAAVSSRRIAEKAGLKSQLVHYHFGSMDDLFLAVFRRSDDAFFSTVMKIMALPNPLRELWSSVLTTEEATLALEFTAIATHRKGFRDELIRSADRVRSLENFIIAKAFGERKTYNLKVSANVFGFILQSMSRALVMESSIGITKNHAEISQFVEDMLENWNSEAAGD
jgi:AcrR family transcriptional regulator